MKKVLFITYLFPPVSGPGIQRTLKFVKYLPSFGWKVEVLTVKSNRSQDYSVDYSFSEEIPITTEICRIGSLEPSLLMKVLKKFNLTRLLNIFLFLPDIRVFWILPAVIKGLRLIKKEAIKIVYTTSPPHSTHLIGLILKQLTDIPWAADFRDPWTQNVRYLPESALHKKIDEWLESNIYRKANYIICTTDTHKFNLLKKYKYLNSNKVVVITNGFDEADFKKIKVAKNDRLTFTFTGSFYGDYLTLSKRKWKKLKKDILNILGLPVRKSCLSHSPFYFLKALKEIFEEEPSLKKEFQVRFVGTIGKGSKCLIREFGLENNVEITGWVPHYKSIEYLLSSDVLLITFFSYPDSDYFRPGKLYEYIRSGKPILGLVPQGEASDLIISTRTGFIVDPEDTKLIKEKILNFYFQFKENKLEVYPDWNLIKSFEREKLTRELSSIFNILYY